MKSFLGLVKFCAKYIRDFATLAEPLRNLTRKEAKWQWKSEQQMTFETLKQRLTSADVMSYYNQTAESNIIVDGSPFGLGAILNQKQSDGNFKPVAYASRTLSPVERKWVLDLQQHEFVVKYLPGHLSAVDILSRSPGAESYENDYESTEQFVCYVAQNAVPKAMTIAEIQEASEKEKTICKFENVWRKTNGQRKVN